MNSTNTNGGSWPGTLRRYWCNGGFRGALPANLQQVFKQFVCVTGTWSNNDPYGGSNITSRREYFALVAEPEVMGTTSSYCATLNELEALTQFTWYATSSNRKKNVGEDVSSWSERSPHYENSSNFCRITSPYGVPSNTYAKANNGISPFGCL